MDLGLNSLSTDRLPRAVLARFNEVKGMLRVAMRGKVEAMVGLLVRVSVPFAEVEGAGCSSPEDEIFADRDRLTTVPGSSY